MDSACDDWVLVVVAYIREGLKLVADAREIRSTRGRFNVVAHIDGEEAEGVRGGVNHKVM